MTKTSALKFETNFWQEAIAVLLLGVIIPNLLGLIQHTQISFEHLVLSYAQFILSAWLVWRVSRWTLMRLQERLHFFKNWHWRITFLISIILIVSGSFSFLLLWSWYWYPGATATDWMKIREGSYLFTASVLCVIQFRASLFSERSFFKYAEASQLDTMAFPIRMLVMKGKDVFPVLVEETAYFFVENKLTFLKDKNGATFLCDKPLKTLEDQLNPSLFFRINRQMIVHIDAIRYFKILSNGKVQLTLHPAAHETVFISKSNAPAFKSWLQESKN